MKYFFALSAFVSLAASFTLAAEPIPPIARVLPPAGIEISAKDRDELGVALKAASDRYAAVSMNRLAADVGIYLKAVDYALRHGEFYAAGDVAKARDLLSRAGKRLDELAERKHSWTEQRGLVVRGYTSAIDGSPQPYGLVIPEGLDLAKPAPLYVWLHGRGDKATDLHFIAERQSKVGQISPPGAMVLHAFGRQCLGFKSAGEIDVLEAVEDAQANYKIDPQRIVLMGFSMGGAGAWHLGAHYTDRWVAVSPGAGFVDVKRYQNLKPENLPAPYVQTLWGAYDVPDYVRNLFNVPVVAYSGELDKQKQAADIMAEAYAAHGEKLTHIIGPGVEHKYEPAALKDVLARLDAAVKVGRESTPKTVHLQTKTLRYNKQAWVEVLALKEHWQDSRVDAQLVGDKQLKVTTKNVAALRLSPFAEGTELAVEIDGVKLSCQSGQPVFKRGTWVTGASRNAYAGKYHGLQGPIDDAFLDPFLVVVPSGKSKHEKVEAWVEFELAHFLARWRAVFRGEPRVKKDVDVTDFDIAKYHLVVWGDATSNQVLAKALPRLRLAWDAEKVGLGQSNFAAASHVPVLIRPNPLNYANYLVINSGPTFREAHDRTNSQQNPKLPDWAIIDLSQPPDANAPGKIAAAGFYDEEWKVRDGK